MPSAEHDFLGNLGRVIALAMGYREEEIHSEYSLILADRQGNERTYVVDLYCCRASAAGTPDESAQALIIECGKCDADKLDVLRHNYPFRVLHLPYSFGEAFEVTINKDFFVPQPPGRLDVFLSLVREVCGKHDGLAPMAAIRDEAQQHDIAAEEAKELILECKRRGFVYEPKLDHISILAQFPSSVDIDKLMTGKSREKWERIATLSDLVAELVQERGGLAPISLILEKAQLRGLDPEDARQLLNEMRRKGEVYEPKLGYIGDPHGG